VRDPAYQLHPSPLQASYWEHPTPEPPPSAAADALTRFKIQFRTGRSVYTHAHKYTHLTALFWNTRVSRYQKGKTNLDFTEARDSEWQCNQLGHMQVCTSLQTDNHASTPPLSFLQAGCPSCRPTNSVKALKAAQQEIQFKQNSNTELVSRP